MIEIWMKNCLVSDSFATLQIYNRPSCLQGMTNNVGLAFSVDDTILQLVARQLELVTLHKIFNVVFFETTLCMVFSVTYIVSEGPKIDAWSLKVSRPLIANMIPIVNNSDFFK